jgi:tetratricopeptide (TPR) repeat protein
MLTKKCFLIFILLLSHKAQAAAVCGDPNASDIKNGNDCYVTGYVAGNYAKSIDYSKKVLAKDPNSSKANVFIAFSYMRMSRYEEAVPYFKKALEQGANTYDVYSLYGMTLEALGDSTGAIKWYKQALIIYPALSDVTGKLANLLAKDGKKDEAISLLEKYDATLVQKGKSPIFQGQIMVIKEGVGEQSKSSGTQSSAPQRLQTLKDLYDKGLINKDDYEQKKSQIMKDM